MVRCFPPLKVTVKLNPLRSMDTRVDCTYLILNTLRNLTKTVKKEEDKVHIPK